MVDPHDSSSLAALRGKSYNQAIFKLVEASAAETTDLSSPLQIEARAIKSFMDDNSSQFTYAGLLELHARVRDHSLSVFFRNNHFCSMYRLSGQAGGLYLLVSDLG